MTDIIRELEPLIKAFDPAKSPRYATFWAVRVHRRPSMFDRGQLMDLHEVAWRPVVGSRSHSYEPFRTELHAGLVPTAWMTDSLELVARDAFHEKYLIRDVLDLSDEAKRQLLQGLRGEFAALDQRLEADRKALAQSEADRIIRMENERIAALTPLQRLVDKSVPFDEYESDYPARRRQIVEALLA